MHPTETQLLARAELARGTMGFHFARPHELAFAAGQAISMSLINPPETDAKGNRRTFSIASAPFENEIAIATRIRDSAFKRVLSTLPIGAKVQIRGPLGRFTLEPEPRPAVLIAGGIGITPFACMLRQAAHEKLARPLYLFYANHRREDAPFLDELAALQSRLPNYRFIPTMTQSDDSHGAPAERGRIDGQMLARHLDAPADATYYIAGPPAMVSAMKATLAAAGVAKEHIRADEFFGY